MDFGGDLRLIFLLSLNAIVLFAALYAARRWTRDPVQRALDAMLLWYLIQYASIGLPGICHILSLATMALVALLASAGLVLWARRKEPLPSDLVGRESSIYLIASLVIASFLVQLIHIQCFLPLIDSDAITYHAPAAVQWLQTGKLGLFPTWFFNPANTYSPLAGSTFIAWALAPLGGDALARFVQAPAIFLMFLAVLQIARALGATPLVAAMLAIAAAGGRLCSSEVANPRDDMFLAAFILAAVAGCDRSKLGEPFGAIRIGIAVGLALATKYTAVISLPLLLIMIDAPKAAGWRLRHWLTALGVTLLIAGPWYLRNLILTGNPLYPLEIRVFGHTILKGLFVTERSERLRSLHGIYSIFVEGYHGFPILFLPFLAIGWIGAIVSSWRRWREPLIRACIFGPLVCAAVFLMKSPYGEVRFLFPAVFVAMAAIGLIVSNKRWSAATPHLTVIVGAIMAASLFTAYKSRELVAYALIPAAIIALLTAAAIRADAKLGHSLRPRAYAAMVLALIFTGLLYTMWSPYVATVEYHTPDFWIEDEYYPKLAPGWKYVWDNVPPDAAIAYSQTFLLYPLYGSKLSRRLMHIPVRRDVPDALHFPHFLAPISGEPINDVFTSLLNTSPDRDIWLQRLKQSHAQYLFVFLGGKEPNPPEVAFAKFQRSFTEAYRDAVTVIYKIDW